MGCRSQKVPSDWQLYCPPFDHQDVIDGNASLIYEIVEQINGVVPDAIICCVGGGGLIGGIFKGKCNCSPYLVSPVGLQTVKIPGWKDSIYPPQGRLKCSYGCGC